MTTFTEVNYNQSATISYFILPLKGQTVPEKWDAVNSPVMIFFQSGVVNVIAIVGVVGNIINVTVLRKHGVTKDSTNIFLIALSIFDLMYSVIALIRQMPNNMLLINSSLFPYLFKMFAVYGITSLDQICVILSITVTSTIAIERFVAVFFPFKVARIFTPLRAKLVVLFIVVYVFGLTSPLLARFELYLQVNPKNNLSDTGIKYADWWVSNNLQYYSSILINAMFGVVNIAIVFVCGTTTALKLAHTVHARQQLTSKTPVADVKAHKMLLLVCGMCFLVFAPTVTVETVSILVGILSPYYLIAQTVLYGVHASVNFVIYVAVSRKFRVTYRQMFSRQGGCCGYKSVNGRETQIG